MIGTRTRARGTLVRDRRFWKPWSFAIEIWLANPGDYVYPYVLMPSVESRWTRRGAERHLEQRKRVVLALRPDTVFTETNLVVDRRMKP